jgi:hypothetical protein
LGILPVLQVFLDVQELFVDTVQLLLMVENATEVDRLQGSVTFPFCSSRYEREEDRVRTSGGSGGRRRRRGCGTSSLPATLFDGSGFQIGSSFRHACGERCGECEGASS